MPIEMTVCPVLKRGIDIEFCKKLCDYRYNSACSVHPVEGDMSKPHEFKHKKHEHEDVIPVVDTGEIMCRGYRAR